MTHLYLESVTRCLDSCSCLQNLRHGQRRLHLQRGVVPGAQNDGWQQPERRTATTNSRQNHHPRWHRWRRENLLRRILFGKSRTLQTQQVASGLFLFSFCHAFFSTCGFRLQMGFTWTSRSVGTWFVWSDNLNAMCSWTSLDSFVRALVHALCAVCHKSVVLRWTEVFCWRGLFCAKKKYNLQIFLHVFSSSWATSCTWTEPCTNMWKICRNFSEHLCE